MRKMVAYENELRAYVEYSNELREKKAVLYKRLGELTGRVAELKTKLEKFERTQNRRRFTLLKFWGYNRVTDQREMFDAYVIEIGTGNSFPLTPGYDDIEVWTSEIGEI